MNTPAPDVEQPDTSLSCSSTHCVAIRKGIAYTWAIGSAAQIWRGNRFGQLGRKGNGEGNIGSVTRGKGRTENFPLIVKAVAAGGTKASGHTLLVGQNGAVWSFGCDRWQQLGLGSASAGAVGYTWDKGKLWQTQPQHVIALNGQKVIAVAAGGDHSAALTERGDVFTWGRGEHGQLGHLGTKSFVMPPTKSAFLSGSGADVKGIHALEDCTAVTGNRNGNNNVILRHAGRCPKQILERMLNACACA